jgi:hypothetical protein
MTKLRYKAWNIQDNPETPSQKPGPIKNQIMDSGDSLNRHPLAKDEPTWIPKKA